MNETETHLSSAQAATVLRVVLHQLKGELQGRWRLDDDITAAALEAATRAVKLVTGSGTELEVFKSWLKRENIDYSEAPEEGGEGIELDIQGHYALATVTFRKNGTFEHITAAE